MARWNMDYPSMNELNNLANSVSLLKIEEPIDFIFKLYFEFYLFFVITN